MIGAAHHVGGCMMGDHVVSTQGDHDDPNHETIMTQMVSGPTQGHGGLTL